MKRKNFIGREKVIEDLRDQLFVAIKEHNLWKAEECMTAARNRQVEKDEIFNCEKYGMKPVGFAVKEDSLKILKFLVRQGANSDASGENFGTALHIAAKYGREEVGQFLLNNGAEINSRDAMGKTPLYLASFYCRFLMVGLLIYNGARSNMNDLYGFSALDVIGDDPEVTCNNQTRQKIVSILKCDLEANCKKMLANTGNLKMTLEANDITNAASSIVNPSFALNRANLKGASSMTSSASKPFSFINSIFSWAKASISATPSGLFSNAPALPCAQQPVAVEINLSGATLLTNVIVRKFTGEKYSRSLDDSFLTVKQIKERKLNSLERDVKMALSKCEKLYQYPESSLSNLTISKGVRHQKHL